MLQSMALNTNVEKIVKKASNHSQIESYASTRKLLCMFSTKTIFSISIYCISSENIGFIINYVFFFSLSMAVKWYPSYHNEKKIQIPFTQPTLYSSNVNQFS